MAPLPWDDFEIHELTEVMRQKDKAFADALNRICKHPPERDSPDDLMLRSRELYISHTDPEYPTNAMHVYVQNEHCANWNKICLDSLPGTMYSHAAIDKTKDQNTNLTNITFSEKPRETGNLLTTLHIKVDAWVMLSNNIDVGDGLTNGAMEMVMGIVFKQNNILHAIFVKFDNYKIGCDAKCNSKYKHIDTDSVPIVKIEVSFSVRKNHVRVLRTQFPLFLCWAVTIHKCQGMTLPEIVVDMSPRKGKFRDGQAYVAFSRVTLLDKLHILNYTCEQIQVTKNILKKK